MKLNKISLLSFLMMGACSLSTQPALADWISVANETYSYIKVKITYLEGDHYSVWIPAQKGYKINTNNRCARTVEISIADKNTTPVVLQAPDNGGGIACLNSTIIVKKSSEKLVVNQSRKKREN